MRDFVAAGHTPSHRFMRCSKCGTTIHDFVKKGRLPCLMK